MNETSSKAIQWPVEYQPSRCPVHVRNELNMPVTPDRVWAWLIRAELWPSWYQNSSHLRFIEGSAPDLSLGARFRWKTFGVTIESRVLEFIPDERIAWDAHALGIHCYHAWLIRKTSEGCHVLTEETQHGWLALLGKLLMPTRMHHFHQLWLEGLRENASKGLPPLTAVLPA
ncbi:SRPBCC domain-containing protein [Candidatus Acetothermia bacterium]|nr:SRPBCC domain-containing protein [Candidatus Acetothermia bacterium]